MPWNLWGIFRGLLCGTNNSNKGQQNDIYRNMDYDQSPRARTPRNIPSTKLTRERADFTQKKYNLRPTSANQSGACIPTKMVGRYRAPHNEPYSITDRPMRAFSPHCYNQLSTSLDDQVKKHFSKIVSHSSGEANLNLVLRRKTSSQQVSQQHNQDSETNLSAISYLNGNKSSRVKFDSGGNKVNRSSSIHSQNVLSGKLDYPTSLDTEKKDTSMTKMASVWTTMPNNYFSTEEIGKETVKKMGYQPLRNLTKAMMREAGVPPHSPSVLSQQNTISNGNTERTTKGKDQIMSQNKVLDSVDINNGSWHTNLTAGPVEQRDIIRGTKASSQASLDVTSSGAHGEEPNVIKEKMDNQINSSRQKLKTKNGVNSVGEIPDTSFQSPSDVKHKNDYKEEPDDEKGEMENQVNIHRQEVKENSVAETKNGINSDTDAVKSSEKIQTAEVVSEQTEKVSSRQPHNKSNKVLESKTQASTTEHEENKSSIDPRVNNLLEAHDLKMDYLKTEYHRRHERGLDIYRPLLNVRNCNGRVHIGKRIGKLINVNKEKVLLLVGETGSGKTTWINGLFNYIHGMNWSDDFRVKLIEENRLEQRQNQANSQTKEVTPYTIYYQPWFKFPFTVTVIDTPGFGDTGGIQRDEQIVQQIRTFFTDKGKDGIDHIDAIGFVIQSSLARLTPSQSYVFHSILSLFGKDVSDNIFLLLTFADGQRPQVTNVIEEAKLPYNGLFKFNNSALYVSSKENTEDTDEYEGNRRVDRMFWSMGTANYKKFMTIMETIQSKSLTLTEEVMRERHCLEVMTDAIQENIKITLTKLEQLKMEEHILKKYEVDIERNKNFDYQTNELVIYKKKLDKGKLATNCSICQKTCHPKCTIPDENKHKCAAFENQFCKICPNKCHWKEHRSEPFVYELHIEKVTRTTENLKKKYEDATGKKLSAEQIIKKCKVHLDELKAVAVLLAEGARKCLERLSEIALKPNPLSTTDYIDLMIQEEQFLAGPDWKKSVKQLQEIKEKAKIMQMLQEKQQDIPDANRLDSTMRRQHRLRTVDKIYLSLRKSSDEL